MYSFKIYEEFTKGDKKELLNNSFYSPFYSVFMEEEKIVLGLFKEKFHKDLHKFFEKDYIVIGELNLDEMEDYSYNFYSKEITIKFEKENILETLMSLKPFFPLYLEGQIKDIRSEIFFLFDINDDIINFLQSSLRNKYHVDFSLFNLKGLEDYCIRNIFTYYSDGCAGVSEYVEFQFDRYFNEIDIDETIASKAFLNLLNKELIEDGEELFDINENLALKKIDGFNNLYEVFKECYVSYLRKKDNKGYNSYSYEERYKVITDSDKHKTFILDLEKVLREINILEDVKENNKLEVFYYEEKADGYEEYRNSFICFYNNFIIVFSNIYDY